MFSSGVHRPQRGWKIFEKSLSDSGGGRRVFFGDSRVGFVFVGTNMNLTCTKETDRMPMVFGTTRETAADGRPTFPYASFARCIVQLEPEKFEKERTTCGRRAVRRAPPVFPSGFSGPQLSTNGGALFSWPGGSLRRTISWANGDRIRTTIGWKQVLGQGNGNVSD